jgi:hypothetical protein
MGQLRSIAIRKNLMGFVILLSLLYTILSVGHLSHSTCKIIEIII